MILFLTYSEFSSDSIRHSLGKADYSYYFVQQRFLPLLRELGEVVELEAPPSDNSVAPLLEQYQRLYYLSFTPPDKCVHLTACPVIPVFAWEYSTIPDEAFTGPGDDWVSVLRGCAGAITHSSFALDVIRRQVGADYPAASIPAPLWDEYGGLRRERQSAPPGGIAALELSGTVIDSACYDISSTSVKPVSAPAGAGVEPLCPQWNGRPLVLPLREGEADAGVTLIGFNDREPWGVWTRSGYPWIMLPEAVHGEVELEIELCGYAANVGRPLYIELGESRACVMLGETLRSHRLRLRLDAPTSFLTFQGVGPWAVGMPDPRDIGIGLARLEIRQPGSAAQASTLQLDFSEGANAPEFTAHGFHPPEPKGCWSAQAWCMLELPESVCGRVRLEFDLFHHLQPPDTPVRVSLGGAEGLLELREGCTWATCELEGVAATDFLVLDGLATVASGEPDDSRLLGLGITRLTFRDQDEELHKGPARAVRETPVAVTRGDILYTTVLNPNDGRKNWEDIITAFVYAFRDNPRATLLVKITNTEMSLFFEDIFTFFMELHPFTCRLVFLKAYLDDRQYAQMIANSHFVVNASRGEGQCLPLMEFMSSGVPALAPGNTAMLDYLSRDSGLVVRSTPELTYWPHDPRQVFRTCWDRIDWDSLRVAFERSEKVWRTRRRRYKKMAQSAVESQRNYCSRKTATTRLRQLLDAVDAGEHP